MFGARDKATLLTLLILLASGLSPAHGQSFVDAPIDCGQRSPYKTCTAAFDGWMLRTSYKPPEGKDSVAVYRRCAVDPVGIHCVIDE